MAFNRPTLREISDRIKADLDVSLGGAGARLRRSFEFALAKAVAGAVHLLHGHLDWASKQLFPDTSDEEQLVRQASLYGIDRKQAAQAQGTILVTGSASTLLPAGTEWQNEAGDAYTTDADATIPASPPYQIAVAITAAVAGAAGNADAGATLSITSPVAGISSEATVESPGLESGTDLEDAEDLRDRLKDRMRLQPQGGGTGDYVAWAKEVSFVTRAWERAGDSVGPGAVHVFFTADGNAGGPVPSAAQVAEVQAYLQEIDDGEVIGGVAPVHAAVTAFAPVESPQDMTIELSPNSATVRAAITAELEDLFFDLGQPGGTIRLSKIREAISRATGEDYHDLTSPTSDITVATNALPTVGTINFITA